MKTVGQILQAARLAQKIELEDIARVTKIRPQALKALEADDYRQLANGTVARGFIHNYSDFLSLRPEAMLAIFRRDFTENRQGQVVPRSLAQPVSQPNFWSPKTTVIAVIALVFTVFAAYLIYQYTLLLGPPPLRLSPPKIQAHTVEISGRTDPEATVSVNGQLVILDKGGYFSFRLPLNPDAPSVSITATSKSGKITTKSLKL